MLANYNFYIKTLDPYLLLSSLTAGDTLSKVPRNPQSKVDEWGGSANIT